MIVDQATMLMAQRGNAYAQEDDETISTDFIKWLISYAWNMGVVCF